MSWTSITTDQPISYVLNNACYRNSARETLAGGEPVFFVPDNATLNDYGYGGPKYQYGYTYYNSSSVVLGNCTWWCWGRLFETNGVRMPNMGNAINWYSNYTGSKDTNANNIQPGDIIVYGDNDAGHVMFAEDVSGSTIYISHSAYSTRSAWSGYACRTGTYDKSDIVNGNTINIYKDIGGSVYNVTVIGVIHTGVTPPTPPSQLDAVTIAIAGEITRNKKGVNLNVKLYRK